MGIGGEFTLLHFLYRYTQLTIFDSISASVDQGRVVLSGWVTMPYKKDDLERRVADRTAALGEANRALARRDNIEDEATAPTAAYVAAMFWRSFTIQASYPPWTPLTSPSRLEAYPAMTSAVSFVAATE